MCKTKVLDQSLEIPSQVCQTEVLVKYDFTQWPCYVIQTSHLIFLAIYLVWNKIQ